LRYIRCTWVPMYVGPDFETSRQPETVPLAHSSKGFKHELNL
jgi:hypothetical protein